MNELENAVDLVEQGWCAGSLLKDGNVCAAGAIYAAHKGYSHDQLSKMNWAEQANFEFAASVYAEDSEVARALADEIIVQGQCKHVSEDSDSYSVIWGFNDKLRFEFPELDTPEFKAAQETHKYEVIEMMKRAAKRLN